MIKIIDSAIKYDAVICLMGDFPGIDAIVRFTKNGKPLIAADGAATRLLEKNIIPNYIVGDLDSFDRSKFAATVPENRIIRYADQETNDFEKCLIFAFHNQLHSLLVLGFHGGLLEHTLNNWSIMKKYSGVLDLKVYENERLSFVLKSGKYVLHACKGDLISLIPQPRAILTTENMDYPLKKDLLELGVREGARNVFSADVAGIEIHEGEILAFMPCRV